MKKEITLNNRLTFIKALKNVFYTLLCCVIGHKTKGNTWHHIEHEHSDWFYSTECKRCGQTICWDNKPKRAIIVEYEPNAT